MEKNYYKLTPAQELLVRSQKFTVHKQVNNICTSLLLDKELDINLLKEAIRLEYERNDSLRIRVTKVGSELMQYISDTGFQEIGMLDFTGKTQEFQEDKLHSLASKPITKHDQPLSKVYIMKSYDGKTGLFFAVSHMVLDSWGITIFYKDVLALYDALERGGEMPKPLAPYENLLKRDLEYINTPQYQKDKEFWGEFLYSTEPIYTDINGRQVLEKYRLKNKKPDIRYGQIFTLYTKSKNKMLWIPKEVVDRIQEYCTTHNCSMQSHFLLAYRNYLAKVNDREKDIFFQTSIARRGTLEQKNTGGSLVMSLPFRAVLEEDMTVREALADIEEKKVMMYRHSEMNPGELLSMVKEKFNTPQIGTYFSVLFTFQPVQLTTLDGTRIYSNWYGNGTFPLPLYLTVMDGDGTGGMKCYYEYQTKIISEETLDKLHSYMINSMLAGVENDQHTIGEMLDLN